MDYNLFKYEFHKLSGIDLNYYKEKQMKRRIESQIKRSGFESYSDFLAALRKKDSLYEAFLSYITINVTEFYRNPGQWDTFEKEILPMVLQRSSTPKIWSCACSTGEEPYTIAMILAKYLTPDKIKILASDIDDAAIAKAKEAKYSFKSVESLPNEFKSKYFRHSEDDKFELKCLIKRCVEFRHLDLLKDDYPMDCDIIVCRNVLIYFTETAKDMIYKRFNKSLKPNAILYLGNTEQIIKPDKYKLKSLKTFYYTKDEELPEKPEEELQ